MAKVGVGMVVESKLVEEAVVVKEVEATAEVGEVNKLVVGAKEEGEGENRQVVGEEVNRQVVAAEVNTLVVEVKVEGEVESKQAAAVVGVTAE